MTMFPLFQRSTLFVAIIAMSIAAAAARAEDHPKRSPFEYIRWKDVTPEVKVRGAWYHLDAINNIPVSVILEHCRKLHLGAWQRRFDEDLVQVLNEMDQPPGEHVALEVRHLTNGEPATLRDVPLTEENRQAIIDAKYGDLDESGWMISTPGVNRTHRSEPDPAFLGLTKRIETDQVWAKEEVTSRQVAEDLDDLEWHLDNRYAYVDRVGFDYRSALDTIRVSVKDGITRGALAVQLMKFVAYFGDGHTRLNRWSDINKSKFVPWVQFLPAEFVPFALAAVDGRVAAYALEPKRLLDEQYPYVRSLDGEPVDRWIAAAGSLVAKGTPQFIRESSVKYAMFGGFVRSELGLPRNSTLMVELESADGSATRKFPIGTSPAPHVPRKGAWVEHGKIAGDIGYLRISRMDVHPAFVAKLTEAMSDLRDTAGLVIDLRDNSGGSRETIRTLFPYFLAPGETPFIANVSAYRVPPGRNRNKTEGYLASRFLYPVTSQYWTEKERAAIGRFAESFHPERRLPQEKFSVLHYFVLTPRTSPGYYHYKKPIAVLMGPQCFDSTEVLLGAFKGRPNVTLIGMPSGGGVGRATNLALMVNTGFRIQFSSMVSFRPNGKLYDGRGIQPDINVEPTLSDILGKTDTAIDAAVRHFKR